MYLAVELGSIDLNPVLQGALATISYFLVGTAVLIIGFIVVDVLTPGKLRQLVFVDRRPNAVILACANYIAVAAVVICAITSSYRQLGQGLIGVAVYGIIYELALLTLSTSLNGGGIVATSLIVAGYIAALGAGALLVKPLLHWAAIAFVAVEALLAIIGGLSAATLYVMFSFIGGSLLMLALGTALIGAL